MKSYLVRMTPLIFEWSGGVFASLSYVRRSLDRAVPDPGFVLGCRGPGGLLRSRSGFYGRGLTWRFRQQKRHLVFAPRCLTCYTERIQLEL